MSKIVDCNGSILKVGMSVDFIEQGTVISGTISSIKNELHEFILTIESTSKCGIVISYFRSSTEVAKAGSRLRKVIKPLDLFGHPLYVGDSVVYTNNDISQKYFFEIGTIVQIVDEENVTVNLAGDTNVCINELSRNLISEKYIQDVA